MRISGQAIGSATTCGQGRALRPLAALAPSSPGTLTPYGTSFQTEFTFKLDSFKQVGAHGHKNEWLGQVAFAISILSLPPLVIILGNIECNSTCLSPFPPV